MNTVYYITRSARGWRVKCRGEVWDFDGAQEASQFAIERAEGYARASGRATFVRMQDENGSFQQLRSFPGITGSQPITLHIGPRRA